MVRLTCNSFIVSTVVIVLFANFQYSSAFAESNDDDYEDLPRKSARKCEKFSLDPLIKEFLNHPDIKCLKDGTKQLAIEAMYQTWDFLVSSRKDLMSDLPLPDLTLVTSKTEKQVKYVSVGAFVRNFKAHPSLKLLGKIIGKLVGKVVENIAAMGVVNAILPGHKKRRLSMDEMDETFIDVYNNGCIRGVHRVARSLENDQTRIKRHISSKTLVGSPYETKNQASFPVSGSFKTNGQRGPQTLLINH